VHTQQRNGWPGLSQPQKHSQQLRPNFLPKTPTTKKVTKNG
jgi:hypothetical protein